MLCDIYPSSFVGGLPIIYIYSTLHHIATDYQRQTSVVLTGTMSHPCMRRPSTELSAFVKLFIRSDMHSQPPSMRVNIIYGCCSGYEVVTSLYLSTSLHPKQLEARQNSDVGERVSLSRKLSHDIYIYVSSPAAVLRGSLL